MTSYYSAPAGRVGIAPCARVVFASTDADACRIRAAAILRTRYARLNASIIRTFLLSPEHLFISVCSPPLLFFFLAHFSVFLLPSWPSVPRSALSIRELKTSSGRPRVPTPLNHGMKKNGVVGGVGFGGYRHKFLVYCRSGSRSAAL